MSFITYVFFFFFQEKDGKRILFQGRGFDLGPSRSPPYPPQGPFNRTTGAAPGKGGGEPPPPPTLVKMLPVTSIKPSCSPPSEGTGEPEESNQAV